MIQVCNSIILLECDICGIKCEKIFKDFCQAIDWKNDTNNDWVSKKHIIHGWMDICPDCQSFCF